jgi:hypothetical protein
MLEKSRLSNTPAELRLRYFNSQLAVPVLAELLKKIAPKTKTRPISLGLHRSGFENLSCI